MPRFAANLAYLFTERPFMERFAAAATAGFKAVELQFPYEFAPSAVRAELERHGLAMLGINTPPGRREAGDFGLAALAEYESIFRSQEARCKFLVGSTSSVLRSNSNAKNLWSSAEPIPNMASGFTCTPASETVLPSAKVCCNFGRGMDSGL